VIAVAFSALGTSSLIALVTRAPAMAASTAVTTATQAPSSAPRCGVSECCDICLNLWPRGLGSPAVGTGITQLRHQHACGRDRTAAKTGHPPSPRPDVGDPRPGAQPCVPNAAAERAGSSEERDATASRDSPHRRSTPASARSSGDPRRFESEQDARSRCIRRSERDVIAGAGRPFMVSAGWYARPCRIVSGLLPAKGRFLYRKRPFICSPASTAVCRCRPTRLAPEVASVRHGGQHRCSGT
jgi:hypothetical protein